MLAVPAATLPASLSAAAPGHASRGNGKLQHAAVPPAPLAAAAEVPGYAELQVTSNFSFLRGASHPEELVERAAALGYRAMALTDRNTLAGVVRAYQAARRTGLRFIAGARLDLQDGPSLLCLPAAREGYGRLARLITRGRRRAPKGECLLKREDVVQAAGAGQIFIAIPPETPGTEFAEALAWYRDRLDAPLYLAATRYLRGGDEHRLGRLSSMSAAAGIPLVATGDVHQHDPARRRLCDVLTCIRERCAIDAAGWRLAANAERHLKTPAAMARLFREYPQAMANAVEIAERCRFSLGELSYEYPSEITRDDRSPQEELERLTWRGAARRYPEGIPRQVSDVLRHELALIGQLEYAPYFLTVEDIVRTARDLGILCQGRGSAANSAVCYCLGITSVDPVRINLLFERFISAERGEAPDIDVDFEHERREEIIQYIYRKYGRERAGLTATVVTYRARSALRDTGKAMGLSKDLIDRLLSTVSAWSKPAGDKEAMEEGFDPQDRRLALTLELASELYGFPRHLSQHTGGFVISRGPLCEIVPIHNAAMPDRTVIEWNKDDLEALGLIKVDVLGLGMLSCIRRAFDLLESCHGVRHTMTSVPQDDPAVYEMIQRADTVGVFQIESRAQMAMLPRLKPATFYDLVIEVAIVRPGPIQGDMVHPYLRRRKGVEPVRYPSEELRGVLEKTLGVPLFQEQAMKIAIIAAGFAPSEADQLRRAMASFRDHGTIGRFRDKFISGMKERGYEDDFAERCFQQIEGFSDYGFPESHAASFALLVYISSWLKRHYPEVFGCALLNSQPMGFYAPAQIVRDARDHGVEVRPVDVNHSAWECTLEPAAGGPAPVEVSYPASVEADEGPACGVLKPGRSGKFALRLGFNRIRGMSQKEALLVTDARDACKNGFLSPRDLWMRTGISYSTLVRLANADAFTSMELDRRQAAWSAKSLRAGVLPLFERRTEGRGPQADGREPQAEGRGLQADGEPRTEGHELRTGGHELRTGGLELQSDGGEPGSNGCEPRTDGRHAAFRPEPALPVMSVGEQVAADYRTTGLSLKRHPVSLLRERLSALGACPAKGLEERSDGDRVAVAGIVLVRQRPGTARNVMFVTLEDETGVANLVVFPDVQERWRRDALTARLMICRGKLQREDGVIHVIAHEIRALDGWLAELSSGGLESAPPVESGDGRERGRGGRSYDGSSDGRSYDGSNDGRSCDGRRDTHDAAGSAAFVDRGRLFR